MKNVMKKLEISGRMAKWTVKLSTYNIKYEPRSMIRSQALMDFVADFNNDLQAEVELETKRFLEKNKEHGCYSLMDHQTKEEVDYGSY